MENFVNNSDEQTTTEAEMENAAANGSGCCRSRR